MSAVPPVGGELYQQIQAEFACEHADTELRRRIARNGAVSFCHQCLRCGDKNVVVRGATLTKAQRDSAPLFDDDLRQAYNQQRWDEYARRRAIAEQSEAEQWWTAYNTYLASPEWRDRRKRVLDRDHHQCKACERRPATQVHHLTYAHLGQEPLFDLVSVCEPCHEALTEADRKRRQG